MVEPLPVDSDEWEAFDIECGECGQLFIWAPTYADQPLPDMCPACEEQLRRGLTATA